MERLTFKDKVDTNMLTLLGAEAFAVYSDTDPLDIYEKFGLYYVRGCFTVDGLTLDDLRAFLLSLPGEGMGVDE